MPISVTKSGVMLNAPTWLVCIEHTLMTSASTGSMLRLATDCSAVMMCALSSTGSIPRCR